MFVVVFLSRGLPNCQVVGGESRECVIGSDRTVNATLVKKKREGIRNE
mgnify:FL=1